MLYTRELFEIFIQPGITTLLTTDKIRGPCVGLAVVNVKVIDNSEFYSR